MVGRSFWLSFLLLCLVFHKGLSSFITVSSNQSYPSFGISHQQSVQILISFKTLNCIHLKHAFYIDEKRIFRVKWKHTEPYRTYPCFGLCIIPPCQSQTASLWLTLPWPDLHTISAAHYHILTSGWLNFFEKLDVIAFYTEKDISTY